MVDENHYAVTLAVAGFEEHELYIQVEGGLLTIPEAMKPKRIAITSKANASDASTLEHQSDGDKAA